MLFIPGIHQRCRKYSDLSSMSSKHVLRAGLAAQEFERRSVFSAKGYYAANYRTGSNNSFWALFTDVLCARAWQDKTPGVQFKPFNQCVKKDDVKALLKPGMWAATVDLSDAYYHIGNILDNIYYIG